jgi:hypothetical protein
MSEIYLGSIAKESIFLNGGTERPLLPLSLRK